MYVTNMYRKHVGIIFLCICVISFGTLTRAAPFYSSLSDSQSPSGTYSNRVIVAEIDKPIDTIMEAVLELGGNVLFLVPPRDYEKRDPPDLGTNRSYSGQRTAKVMYGQLASNSPVGPGRRKRHLLRVPTERKPLSPSPYYGSYSLMKPEEKLQ